MNTETTPKKEKTKLLPQKVATIAGNTVTQQGYVSTIDLFLGLGWLSQANLLDWKKGRVPYLERVITANLKKISKALKAFIHWANHPKLKKSITVYQHKNNKLRFSKSGHPTIEAAYSTHFVLVKSVKKETLKDTLTAPHHGRQVSGAPTERAKNQ